MNRKILIPVLIIAAFILALLFTGGIAERRYRAKAEKLAERIPADRREHLEGEFYYVIDKFWSAYENGLVTENDLLDVTDYMDDLNRSERVGSREIVEFLDYVSGIYTQEIIDREEEKYRSGGG
jgi:hypothetical protein